MKAALMAEPSQIGNDEPTDGFVGRMSPCPHWPSLKTAKKTISVQQGGFPNGFPIQVAPAQAWDARPSG
jgi:hypothetical protein